MSDLLTQGALWLEQQRRRHLSRTVTYCRGALSAEVPATVGQSTFLVDDGTGAAVRMRMRDYLIAVPDLVLDGHAVVPQRGDQIHESVGACRLIHEVVPPSATEPEWRYCDAHQFTFRIHTKLIAEEPLP